MLSHVLTLLMERSFQRKGDRGGTCSAYRPNPGPARTQNLPSELPFAKQNEDDDWNWKKLPAGRALLRLQLTWTPCRAAADAIYLPETPRLWVLSNGRISARVYFPRRRENSE